jgi:hypothetical protein
MDGADAIPSWPPPANVWACNGRPAMNIVRKSRPHPQVWGVEHSGRSSLYLPAAPDAPPGRQPSSRRKWPRPRGDVDGADAIWPPNGAARCNTDNNGRPSIDAMRLRAITQDLTLSNVRGDARGLHRLLFVNYAL